MAEQQDSIEPSEARAAAQQLPLGPGRNQGDGAGRSDEDSHGCLDSLSLAPRRGLLLGRPPVE